MHRFLFAPHWLALHTVTLALVMGFVALGWWQHGVYQESEARHSTREAAAAPLTEIVRAGEPLGAAVDRAVTATGSYVDELVVPARVHDGVLGVYAVGVLETTDGFAVVLRGWVDDQEPMPSTPGGSVTVTGHLVAAEVAAEATGHSTLPSGQVGYLSPEPVAATAGFRLSDLYDGYLIVADEQPEPAIAPQRLDVDTVAPVRNVSPWQNLSYWAQWWVFAVAVLVFWGSFIKAGVRRRRATPPARDALSEPSPRPSAQR